MSHKIEWLDEGDIVVDCVTPNEDTLRVIFGDGRVFLLHCVVPILGGDSWNQGRIKAVCKSVLAANRYLVPAPSTKWGRKIHKLVTAAEASTGENGDDASDELTELTVMSFASLERGNSPGSRNEFEAPWLASIESGDGRSITVGIRDITPSQMTGEELSMRAQESSAKETKKIGKQIASATKKISQSESRISKQAKGVRKRENALSDYIAIGATLEGASKQAFTNKVRSFLQEAACKILADPVMDRFQHANKFPKKYDDRRALIYDLLRAECGHAKKIDIAKKWRVEKRTLQRWTVPLKKTAAFISFTTAVKHLVPLKNPDR
jgi:hypothetical protein